MIRARRRSRVHRIAEPAALRVPNPAELIDGDALADGVEKSPAASIDAAVPERRSFSSRRQGRMRVVGERGRLRRRIPEVLVHVELAGHPHLAVEAEGGPTRSRKTFRRGKARDGVEQRQVVMLQAYGVGSAVGSGQIGAARPTGLIDADHDLVVAPHDHPSVAERNRQVEVGVIETDVRSRARPARAETGAADRYGPEAGPTHLDRHARLRAAQPRRHGDGVQRCEHCRPEHDRSP